MNDPVKALDAGLLRNRNFLAIWGAQILSQTAANALTFALIVLVFEITHANTASSVLILLAIIPAIIFGPLAGVMVDRTDRKLVLIITNVARATAVLLLLPLDETLPTAYSINFLVAAITVFFVPAEAATLPKIVRKQDLLAANSLFSLTFNGSFVVGFSILGPLVLRLYGRNAVWILLTVMYVAAAILVSLLPKSDPVTRLLGVDVAGEAVVETRRDIATAIRYLREHRQIVWVLVYVAITYMLIAVAGALAPGFVTTLDLSERDVYVLSLPAGLGIGIGLVLLNVLGRRAPRATLIHWGLATVGATLIVLAAAPPALQQVRGVLLGVGPHPAFVLLVGATSLVFGAAYTFITVPSFTLLQEELQDEMRGRIFGVLNTLVAVMSLAPLLVVGTIADLFGVGPVLGAAGLVMFAVWAIGRDAHLPAGAKVKKEPFTASD